jgi:predicted dehydrogenase
MLKVGVVGYGYWGPNVVRGLTSIQDAQVVSVCDIDPNALKRVKERYPHIQCYKDAGKILKDPEIDAVAVVTPVAAHYPIAKKALENGKHIFVEKPFTTNVRQAESLIRTADQRGLLIMVDHTFIFTGAVRKIQEVIRKNILGDIFYYDSTRVNLGLFQSDVNVIWDLAPHDFSIMDHVLDNQPEALVAHGMDHFHRGQENLAFITIYFSNRMIAHLNVNWLSPVKIRSTLIGGKKKMLVWNDLESDEKIKIYDRGINVKTKERINRLKVDYRSGDMWAPKVEHQEALRRELKYFCECIREHKQPVNDGHAGLRVVKLLNITDQSLKKGGKLIKIKTG